MAFTKKDKDKKGKAVKPKATDKKKKPVDRNFVGGGWDNTNEFGTFLNLQLNKDKLGDIEADKYGNIKLTVSARKEADEKSGMDIMVYEKSE